MTRMQSHQTDFPLPSAWLDWAIHLQLAAWQLWFEQLGCSLKVAHAIAVSEAWPDIMTDRSLWWTMKRLPVSAE